MLSFTKSFWDKFVICGAIALIGFGTYNLSVATFAQQEYPVTEPHDWNDLLFSLIDHLVGQVGPIVGGAVTLGISFARKKGIAISAEAEEYFVNSTKSFVENQTRFVYKQIKANPQKYAEAFSKGIIPPELGIAARDNVIKQLHVELRSDEFTKTARDMLKNNLEPLVERMFTQHKSESSEKIRKMFNEHVPTAVDAVLLSYKTVEEAHSDKEKIIDEALKSIIVAFDSENMLFSDDIAKTYIKAELNKRIGHLKVS